MCARERLRCLSKAGLADVTVEEYAGLETALPSPLCSCDEPERVEIRVGRKVLVVWTSGTSPEWWDRLRS
jgi:hypothetical protein